MRAYCVQERASVKAQRHGAGCERSEVTVCLLPFPAEELPKKVDSITPYTMALIAKYVARHRLRETQLLDTIADFLVKKAEYLDSKVRDRSPRNHPLLRECIKWWDLVNIVAMQFKTGTYIIYRTFYIIIIVILLNGNARDITVLTL